MKPSEEPLSYRKRASARRNDSASLFASETNVDEVAIPVEGAVLHGQLTPARAGSGVVLFAHGSGSSRHSPRNRFVARAIHESGVGTLLFDLLTPAEEAQDEDSGRFRFDIGRLASRLVAATEWLQHQAGEQPWRIGYFGASTGGAAALVAAAQAGRAVHAVVSRGGRPDLAGDALSKVLAPTLLIVGERDELVLELNEEAFSQLRCPKQLVTVPRATHLFEESGALDHVARLAREWFDRHLKAR